MPEVGAELAELLLPRTILLALPLSLTSLWASPALHEGCFTRDPSALGDRLPVEIFKMSNFITTSSHCQSFLGIDLHTTAVTYADADTVQKITIQNHCN